MSFEYSTFVQWSELSADARRADSFGRLGILVFGGETTSEIEYQKAVAEVVLSVMVITHAQVTSRKYKHAAVAVRRTSRALLFMSAVMCRCGLELRDRYAQQKNV